MAIHPRFWPQFRVLVRNYRLLESNELVQSPNVDLKARASQICLRVIDGEYMGEPRSLDAVPLLGNVIDGSVYRHAAHGVYIPSQTHEDHFPLWVCLQRDDRHQETDVCVLNLFKFEHLAVPISKICWVPTHEAADGRLYTVIGSPGKHGYAKETYLPTVVQEKGLPEQAKFSILPSSLPGLTKLRPEKQETFFKKQYMVMQGQCRVPSKTTALPFSWSGLEDGRRKPRTASGGIRVPSGLSSGDLSSDDESTSPFLEERIKDIQEPVAEGFCRCRCDFSDLGPTYWNPRPLHRHASDNDCSLGSSHQLHCIFAAHRPDHCVIPARFSVEHSEFQHEHCATYGAPFSLFGSLHIPVNFQEEDTTADGSGIVGIERDIDGRGIETGCPADELDIPFNEPCFCDSNGVLDGANVYPWSNLAVPYPESRPISPVPELLPNVQEDLGRLANIPDLAMDMAAVTDMIRDHARFFVTPEPPEICL